MKKDLFPMVGPIFPNIEGEPVNLMQERTKTLHEIGYEIGKLHMEVGATFQEMKLAFFSMLQNQRSYQRQFYHMWT